MKNHWVDESGKRKLSNELDALLMEVWADGGTLQELLLLANAELRDYLGQHGIHAVATDGDNVVVTFKRP